MPASRSFVDVLFILLCATIVMLSQSLRIGSVEASPAKIGGGAISEIDAADVRPVIVQSDHLVMDDHRHESVAAILVDLPASACIVLIAGSPELSHHRMMSIWSEVHDAGVTVKLGVEPIEPNKELEQ